MKCKSCHFKCLNFAWSRQSCLFYFFFSRMFQSICRKVLMIWFCMHRWSCVHENGAWSKVASFLSKRAKVNVETCFNCDSHHVMSNKTQFFVSISQLILFCTFAFLSLSFYFPMTVILTLIQKKKKKKIVAVLKPLNAHSTNQKKHGIV